MSIVFRSASAAIGILLATSARSQTCDDFAAQIATTSSSIQKLMSDPKSCASGIETICTQTLHSEQALLITLKAKYQAQCGGQPFTRVSGTAKPHYYVLALIYAPPGNQSQLVYADGSSTGTKTEFNNTNSQGFELQVETNFARVDFEAGVTHHNGSTSEITKTKSYVLTVTSQTDDLNHNRDQFYVWLNPQIDVSQTSYSAAHLTLGSQTGQNPIVVRLSAADLKNPAQITDPATKAAVANLTPSDFQAILNLDPFFFYQDPLSQDSGRLSLISRSVQIEGPENATDPVIGQGAQLSDEDIEGTTGGTDKHWSLSVLGGFEWDTGPHLAVFAGIHVEEGWEHTKESNTGRVQQIAYNLQSNTVGYHAAYDVYEDNIFKSFVFIPVPDFSSIGFVGTIMHHSVSAGRTITVHFTDGSKRIVNVRADGSFEIYGRRRAISSITYGKKTVTVPKATLQARKITVF